ncbi:hypothetical protein TrRE_jg13022 [Triparma retinervis]|uniref:Histone-binding protein RBBP4-like N-terminal domain-containing protein n=1 Tax=Triparma retinervis TaxID=2557542 RepID=A0A9W7A715_9STRA|nr:hypothetical protein TrRE_jg13022 [Triparma retinervis]
MVARQTQAKPLKGRGKLGKEIEIMGKKTKRKTGGKETGGNKTNAAPSMRETEETFENLKFEDPFEDEFEDNDMEIVDAKEGDDVDADGDVEGGDDAMGAKSTSTSTSTSAAPDAAAAAKQAWMPGKKLEENEVLEYDQSAYTMYHALKPEWPCLSFDIVRDDRGENRTRFPHTVLAVAGTQADTDAKNKLTLMKLSDLSQTYKKSKGEDSDSEEDDEAIDEDEDEGGRDDDPVLEHVNIPHFGGVNRVRTMPQQANIVASHSSTGHVHIWDIKTHMDSLERPGVALNNRAVQSYGGHKEEGYAMDWSPKSAGHFATGDCSGGIHLWQPKEGGRWDVVEGWNAGVSVEDIQWSPTEPTVFATGDCGKNVSIYDTRKKGKPMLQHQAHNTDVNVISWNGNVSNLLASGSDDGVFSVWDLRAWGKAPLARFTTHNTPITSLEWHPTDESMIVVSDEEAVFVYDLSVEEEVTQGGAAGGNGNGDIPPQLLFMHCGSQSNKEAHWHPQIPSLVMTTALTGFNVFIPSNL